jgi:lipoate-protein ligase A
MIDGVSATRHLRLLLDGARDGAANMARDRALLDVMEERLARGEEPAPVLRLYAWSPATVSTGRHQVLEAACDLEACLAEGVDVVQRPTGGRAVLHDDEVTYALIAPARGAFEGSGVERGAALISRALARGLAALGAAVAAVPGVAPSSPRGVREACFVSASRSELVFDGRKVVGSAQMKGRSALLQHGSLPLRFDAERQSRLLGTPAELLRRHAAGLDEALGSRPSADAVRDALARGLSEELDLPLVQGELDADEVSRQAVLEAALRAEPLRFRSAAARPA